MADYGSLPLELRLKTIERLDGVDFNNAVDADSDIWHFVMGRDRLLKRYKKTKVVKKVVTSALFMTTGNLSYFNVLEVTRGSYARVEKVARSIKNHIKKGHSKDAYFETERDKQKMEERAGELDWKTFYRDYQEAISSMDPESFDEWQENKRDDDGAGMADVFEHELYEFLPRGIGRDERQIPGEAALWQYNKTKVVLIVLKAVLDGLF